MEEEEDITFTDWKGVDDYRDPIDPTLLSANFVVVLSEMARIIDYRV